MVEWDKDLEAILANAGVTESQIITARDNVEELIADRERKEEVAQELADALNRKPGVDRAFEVAGDVFVEGRLSVIMEFAQQWRSEIEELGW